jgi:hypothetical protein
LKDLPNKIDRHPTMSGRDTRADEVEEAEVTAEAVEEEDYRANKEEV